MLANVEFWEVVAFILFLGLLVYVGAPGKLTAALDQRGARIRAELEEAERLRAEAEALLQDYQRRRDAAEREAEEIVAQARRQAEAMAADAHVRMEDFVARRTQAAETRIAQAETQALGEVRAAAADAAVTAAERILRQRIHGAAADALIARSIDDVRSRFGRSAALHG